MSSGAAGTVEQEEGCRKQELGRAGGEEGAGRLLWEQEEGCRKQELGRAGSEEGAEGLLGAFW